MASCWNLTPDASRRLCLMQGDLTTAPVDAIVNAANAGLRGGGGVDGAIHRAAGHEALQQACRAVIQERGPLNAGEAVVTPGFALPAKWIIHTVGPIWQGGSAGEEAALRSCYLESLARAQEQGAASVAFPAVSCGVYGYPVEQAARVALTALAHGLQQGLVNHAAMWLFSPQAVAIWTDVAVSLFGPSTSKD